MAKPAVADVATDENVVPLRSGAAEAAKLVFLLGPQNSGKSLLGRAIVERAREQGRDPLVCDGDRNDAYLTKLFGQRGGRPGEVIGVRRPAYADDATVTAWLDAEVSEMEDDGRSRVVDMGGGDLVLPSYAHERELVSMLGEARTVIEPVAVHMILPTVSDLAVLERMERDSLFAPAATILALNAAPAGDTRPADVVFRRVRETEVYRATLARGAREIIVPVLGCMNLVDERGMSFEAAAARTSPLGLAHRQQVATFRRRLNAELDTVAEWLP
jgi:hypothetical protein